MIEGREFNCSLVKKYFNKAFDEEKEEIEEDQQEEIEGEGEDQEDSNIVEEDEDEDKMCLRCQKSEGVYDYKEQMLCKGCFSYKKNKNKKDIQEQQNVDKLGKRRSHQISSKSEESNLP